MHEITWWSHAGALKFLPWSFLNNKIFPDFLSASSTWPQKTNMFFTCFLGWAPNSCLKHVFLNDSTCLLKPWSKPTRVRIQYRSLGRWLPRHDRALFSKKKGISRLWTFCFLHPFNRQSKAKRGFAAWSFHSPPHAPRTPTYRKYSLITNLPPMHHAASVFSIQ